MGLVSAGFPRSAQPSSPSSPWAADHEGHEKPRLRSNLGSRALDLPQQRGLPAGHRLVLGAPERGHSQTCRKTLVYARHPIQDLQVRQRLRLTGCKL